MKTDDHKGLIERRPFRRFAVRLNDVAEYPFNQPRNVGAPKDNHLVICFRKTGAIRIDADIIVEIIERN